jgi:hypothetical protein
MEKLADGLQKLSEDDLLHVVTLVHDNKTSETYTKNDVESTLAFTTVWMSANDMQTANSTSTSTPCPTRWSRCCGTSQPPRPSCRRAFAVHDHLANRACSLALSDSEPEPVLFATTSGIVPEVASTHLAFQA